MLPQAQQIRVDVENAKRQQQWRAACDEIAAKRAAALEAKAAAERQLAAPRTQQAAECAEASYKAAVIAVQETAALKAIPLTWCPAYRPAAAAAFSET